MMDKTIKPLKPYGLNLLQKQKRFEILHNIIINN